MIIYIQGLTIGLALALTQSASVDVELSTKQGKLRGKRTEYPGDQFVDIYLGVPYAKPPTGSLRFRAPVASSSWSGVRDASFARSKCPQPGSFNEDCLYLNVHTWKSKSGTSQALPVMVFIHGGAFYEGSGDRYKGSGLALHSVVVVTINYRLGALGFLATEDTASPGNYGMLDQVLALKWVQENIGDYGGDPNRVTIFGESAGAVSVSLHLLSPLSEGLFHGAIMESGVSLAEWAVKEPNADTSPLSQAKFLAGKVGCSQTNTSELVNCMRKTNVKTIINNQNTNVNIPGDLFWAPVVDKVSMFLPDHPEKLIARGKQLDVPTLRGVNHDEYTYFMTKFPGISHGVALNAAKQSIQQFVKQHYSSHHNAVEKAIENVYLKNIDGFDHGIIRTKIIQFLSDQQFYMPILNETERQAKKGGQSAFMYEFDYRSPNALTPAWEGVPHTAELYYVFGAPLAQSGWTAGDKAVATRVMGYFTNFAKHGNPSFGGVTWEPFTTNKKSYLAIGSSSVMKSNPRPEEEKLWFEILPRLVHTRKPILG